MIRRLYATLWHLAPFLIRRHLRRRALKSPAYLEHWGERFGQAYSQSRTTPRFGYTPYPSAKRVRPNLWCRHCAAIFPTRRF